MLQYVSPIVAFSHTQLLLHLSPSDPVGLLPLPVLSFSVSVFLLPLTNLLSIRRQPLWSLNRDVNRSTVHSTLFCSMFTLVPGGWAAHREENVTILPAWGHQAVKGHWDNVTPSYFLMQTGMMRGQEELPCLHSCCFHAELMSACVLSLWRTTLQYELQ